MAETCHYCGEGGDLRPYGPGGSWVCFGCATASPEREADLKANFGALLDASSAVGDPLIVGGTPDQRREVLGMVDATHNSFGPDDPEWCSAEFTKAGEPNTDHTHCSHWENCEPCCRCGDDTIDPGCDCPQCEAAKEDQP